MGTVMYDPKTDPDFQDPYVDRVEEQNRTLPDGSYVAYTYMHGGFHKSKVKFSLCFPKKENYRGRFFQYLSPFPGPDEEMASLNKIGEDDKIAFALVNGAYYVESNMGSRAAFGEQKDPQIVWKSSAAVAEYSRTKAEEIYQCKRPYGIVYGGSGGGYKTMACIENTRVWDGAVPYVIGSPASLPNTIMLHAQGQRILRHCFSKIVDSLDAGGSGDMYTGLTQDEQQMLREITRMGFPPRTWFLEASGQIDDGSLPVLMPLVKAMDPTYFRDFWTTPGYLGADPAGNAVRDRLVFKTKVTAVHLHMNQEKNTGIDNRNGVDDAWKKMLSSTDGNYIEVESLPEGEDLYLKGTVIVPQEGEAKGQQILLGNMLRKPGDKGGYLTFGMCYGMEDISNVLSRIQPGEEVLLDNSDYIAVQSYYRHQVPADLNYHAWDQFRNPDGSPNLPQRSQFLGTEMTGTGTVQDGNIQGKVIIVQSLMDESTCPWCGAWYRDTVRQRKGSEKDFRIYYMQRCMHGDTKDMDNNMVVDYMGALRQAILDVADWVQQGKKPLDSTIYEVNGGQISVTKRGAERNGLQAEVKLTTNGRKCVHVKVGEPVKLRTLIEVPKGAGEVTSVFYDFKDVWKIPDPEAFPQKGTFTRTIEKGIHGAISEITHVYTRPGMYFASVRITTNRQGDVDRCFTQVKNLDRVRIIVE